MVKSFTWWNKMLCMMLGQLTSRESDRFNTEPGSTPVKELKNNQLIISGL